MRFSRLHFSPPVPFGRRCEEAAKQHRSPAPKVPALRMVKQQTDSRECLA